MINGTELRHTLNPDGSLTISLPPGGRRNISGLVIGQPHDQTDWGVMAQRINSLPAEHRAEALALWRRLITLTEEETERLFRLLNPGLER